MFVHAHTNAETEEGEKEQSLEHTGKGQSKRDKEYNGLRIYAVLVRHCTDILGRNMGSRC